MDPLRGRAPRNLEAVREFAARAAVQDAARLHFADNLRTPAVGWLAAAIYGAGMLAAAADGRYARSLPEGSGMEM